MKFDVIGCSTSWSSRPTSCYLLDEHIMFDCGEGSTKPLVKFYGSEMFMKVDYIFITHYHTDHIFAINQFLSQRIIFHPNKEQKRLTIFGIKGLKDVLVKLFSFALKKEINMEDYVNIIEIEDFSKPIKVGEYEIMPFPLHHGDFDNCGFAIKQNNFVLGYTGDTAFDNNLLKMAKYCNALVCDVSGYENKPNHMGVEGYNELRKMFPQKTFFAVHCSDPVYFGAEKLGLNKLDSGDCLKIKDNQIVKCLIIQSNNEK